MPHRYFTTEIANGTAALRGTDAHHLARVMRAKLGETRDPMRRQRRGVHRHHHRLRARAGWSSVEPGYPSAAEPSVEVTLLAGYPKQDKLEQIIHHGVELGAAISCPSSAATAWPPPKKRSRRTSATTASRWKPPSSAAGACCRMWPCRCPTSGPCAAPLDSTILCSSATSAAARPCASCWQRQSPPTANS